MKSSNTIEKLVRHPPDIFQTTSGHPSNHFYTYAILEDLIQTIPGGATAYLGGSTAYLVVGNTLRLKPASYAELGN